MDHTPETREAVAEHYASYLDARNSIKTVLIDLVHRRIPLFIALADLNRHLNEIWRSATRSLALAMTERREQA